MTEDPTSWSAGIQRYQETAKWVVGIWGAIGGALVVSLSLANLGSIDGDQQTNALAGFALAIVGISIAVLGVGTVMAPTRPDFFEIDKIRGVKKKVNSDSAFLFGYQSLEELGREFTRVGRERVRAYELAYEAESNGDYDRTQMELAKAKRCEHLLQLINPAVDHVKLYALRHIVRWRFHWVAIPTLVVGVLLTSCGAAMFAVNTYATDPKDLVVPNNYVTPARFQMTDLGREKLANIFSEECLDAGLDLLILRVSKKGTEVVTLPGHSCSSLVMMMPYDWGVPIPSDG